MVLKEIIVKSPTGEKDAIFHWIDEKKLAEDEQDDNMEIVDTIKWIVNDIQDLRSNENVCRAFRELDWENFECVKKLADVYNDEIARLRKTWDSRGIRPKFALRRANDGHLKHIIQQCYSRAVKEPERLNQYMPFSAEVYGETSFELVTQMINSVQITADDAFVDLGSGIGQVVLHVAAATEAKSCIGVERADYPAKCAESMDKEFRMWMAFYGKPYQPYKIEKGDFLVDDNKDKIVTASVIFANNFAFGPQVDHQLKERFGNLKEGARIVSSKAFCPLNFRITDRNLTDIGSIMQVVALHPIKGAVSWTDKAFSYFVHTIDRTLLEKYFAKLKNPALKCSTDPEVRRDRKGRVIDGKDDMSGSAVGSSRSTSRDVSRGGSHDVDSEGESESNEDGDDMRRFSAMGGPWQSSSRLRGRGQRQQQDKLGKGRTRRAAMRVVQRNQQQARFRRNAHGKGAKLMQHSARSSRAHSSTRSLPNTAPSTSAAKARRTRLLQHDGLQLLHATTIASVASASRPSMADHDSTLYNSAEMARFAPFYRPREIHGMAQARHHADTEKDNRLYQRNDVVPVALEQYLELVRQSFMEHFASMREPSYKARLEAELKKQQDRNTRIKEVITSLNDNIKVQHTEGVAHLQQFFKKVGIEVGTPVQFFSEARKLIKNNRNLAVKIEQIKKNISTLQSDHDQLIHKAQQQVDEADRQKRRAQEQQAQEAESQKRLLEEHVKTYQVQQRQLEENTRLLAAASAQLKSSHQQQIQQQQQKPQQQQQMSTNQQFILHGNRVILQHQSAQHHQSQQQQHHQPQQQQLQGYQLQQQPQQQTTMQIVSTAQTTTPQTSLPPQQRIQVGPGRPPLNQPRVKKSPTKQTRVTGAKKVNQKPPSVQLQQQTIQKQPQQQYPSMENRTLQTNQLTFSSSTVSSQLPHSAVSTGHTPTTSLSSTPTSTSPTKSISLDRQRVPVSSFIYSSLEELIKQEIMRPSTPPPTNMLSLSNTSTPNKQQTSILKLNQTSSATGNQSAPSNQHPSTTLSSLASSNYYKSHPPVPQQSLPSTHSSQSSSQQNYRPPHQQPQPLPQRPPQSSLPLVSTQTSLAQLPSNSNSHGHSKPPSLLIPQPNGPQTANTHPSSSQSSPPIIRQSPDKTPPTSATTKTFPTTCSSGGHALSDVPKSSLPPRKRAFVTSSSISPPPSSPSSSSPISLVSTPGDHVPQRSASTSEGSLSGFKRSKLCLTSTPPQCNGDSSLSSSHSSSVHVETNAHPASYEQDYVLSSVKHQLHKQIIANRAQQQLTSEHQANSSTGNSSPTVANGVVSSNSGTTLPTAST